MSHIHDLTTHLPEVFPLPLQNHFLVVVHLTTAAGSWIPQYLCEGRRRGRRRRGRRKKTKRKRRKPAVNKRGTATTTTGELTCEVRQVRR